MVTERAKEALLRKKVAANMIGRDVGWRITHDAGGTWTLFPDRPGPDDQVIEHGGTIVLMFGPPVREVLDQGSKVDCLPNAQGEDELVVSRPRAGGAPPSRE